MNDATGMKHEEAKQPPNYENSCNDVQQISLKIYFLNNKNMLFIPDFNMICFRFNYDKNHKAKNETMINCEY